MYVKSEPNFDLLSQQITSYAIEFSAWYTQANLKITLHLYNFLDLVPFTDRVQVKENWTCPKTTLRKRPRKLILTVYFNNYFNKIICLLRDDF
jgi:hypothetical protein